MKQNFTISGRLPGFNQLTHGHWAKCARLKRESMSAVMWYAKAARPRLVPCEKRVTVRLTCYEQTRGRRRDEDNIIGGAQKIILDALQRLGVLQGDDPRWVQMGAARVEWVQGDPRIVVELEEVEE